MEQTVQNPTAQQEQITSADVRHEVSKTPIMFDEFKPKNEFTKEGTKTAQIRQVLTKKSYYPSKKVASSMQANIFDAKSFGFEEKEFTSVETRVAWIPVPESTTEEEMKAKLEAAHKNGATIYRILSNEPILDENQKFAIQNGMTTKDTIANAQVVRYPKDHEQAGKIWTDDKGNVQYRRTLLWLTPMADKDLRGTSAKYITPQIQAELAAVTNHALAAEQGASFMTGQTL